MKIKRSILDKIRLFISGNCMQISVVNQLNFKAKQCYYIILLKLIIIQTDLIMF